MKTLKAMQNVETGVVLEGSKYIFRQGSAPGSAKFHGEGIPFLYNPLCNAFQSFKNPPR